MNDRYIEKLEVLLNSYGIGIEGKDSILNLTIDLVISEIKSFCNIEQIDPKMDYIVIKRALGRFLRHEIQTCDNLDDLGLEKSVKSISEGDVSYSFSSSLNKDDLINSYITYLEEFGQKDLYTFRKMRW